MHGSKLLHEASALVEKGWCQGAEARDARGRVTRVGAADCVAWSLLGALQATTAGDPETGLEDIGVAVSALAELINDPSLAHWNDAEARTKLEVLSVLKDAEVLALEAFLYYEISEN
jgi:hypothetical protein